MGRRSRDWTGIEAICYILWEDNKQMIYSLSVVATATSIMSMCYNAKYKINVEADYSWCTARSGPWNTSVSDINALCYGIESVLYPFVDDCSKTSRKLVHKYINTPNRDLNKISQGLAFYS